MYFFDMKGPAIFVDEDMINYTLGYINSKFCNYIMNLLNPSIVSGYWFKKITMERAGCWNEEGSWKFGGRKCIVG